MRFRYKNPRGKVLVLGDVTWLAQAVRDGLVTSDTPLAVGDERAFRRAELVVAYQQIVVALSRNPLGTRPAASVPRPAPVRARGRLPRRAIAVVLCFLAGAAVLVGMRSLQSAPPDRPAPAPRAAGPGMAAALATLDSEFGDSIGRRQRGLEDWFGAQRFEQRLSGRALASPAGLRAIRGAAAAYAIQVDSMLNGLSALSSQLALRADSLETASASRSGLLAAADAALGAWERHLKEYGDLQLSRAAALDSLAGFLLESTQSFVVREGQAVFLSREDGARFRALLGSLEDLAGRERRWADEVRRAHPGWMSGLAPAERPALQRDAVQRSNQ